MKTITNTPKLALKYFAFMVAMLLVMPLEANAQATPTSPKADSGFTHRQIDHSGPQSPWAKATGDIDGDGLVDLIVGGHEPPLPTFIARVLNKLGAGPSSVKGELVWYHNPDWQKHLITQQYAIRTDMETADINRDGHTDIALLTDSGIVILFGPDWYAQRIDTARFHDLELADFDADGDMDILVRNQSLFDHNNGNALYFFRQDSHNVWTKLSMPAPHGEGLAVADINNDHLPDVIVNRVWLKNPGSLNETPTWLAQPYAADWLWDDVFIDVADMNSDGFPDILLAPSEQQGDQYQISWFQAPASTEQSWQQHIVDNAVEAVHHFVAAADINGDGHPDVITAEMNQSKDPDEVKVYINHNNGLHWQKQLLAETGSHSMRALDIDGDFDIDLFGANWEFKQWDAHYPVSLWVNQSNIKPTWRRHIVDANRPRKALFIDTADIDGDQWTDIITGAFWYKNPGVTAPMSVFNSDWQRNPVGKDAMNMALVADFDNDGDNDIFSSSWQGQEPTPNLYDRLLNRFGWRPFEYEDIGNRFTLALNNGAGVFDMHGAIPAAKGDYLQGAALIQTIDAQHNPTKNTVLLSWHKSGHGIQALAATKGLIDNWQWYRLSDFSQDEAITVGDIDRDGDLDIILGTQWLRNNGGSWQQLTIHATANASSTSEPNKLPDRNKLVDINHDGKLDVVVGYQAVSRLGKLAWYEQGDDVEQHWQEHIIAKLVGPMSIDVADIDGDGDMDIAVGEHNLKNPTQARLIIFENLDGLGMRWQGHLVYRGDEHHNGVKLVDLDQDGDLDIVSIGWGHHRVLVYENPRF